ncbi:Uncharacterised protein [Mycobacteroides abscessus subsp. abscessus]|nr:Uncharacterised protein [Mycobacteroides abscessus subsp. abscessus]
MIAGGQGVEQLGDLYVPLVGRHHETGMSEMGCLVGDCGGNGRVGGADGGHRDACSEVDEGVAVGVDDHAAIGVDGIDRRGGAHTRRHRGAAALGQCTGPGSR